MTKVHKQIKKILSIDGGGIRGTFPAAFLSEIERDLKHPLIEYFDLITGTSTGGIIAIGLALGFSASDILEMYEQEGPKIFNQSGRWEKRFLGRFKRSAKHYFWGPKYDATNLKLALQNILQERKLGESQVRLMIPAWHAQSDKVYIFKTAHHERFSTDYRELAVDAAMATAAAPTFFKEYITARDVGLVDGGVWANNPTGIAVAEAIGTLGWKAKDIRVLNIGCLDDVRKIRDAYGKIGIAPKLAGLFMAGQSHGSLGLSHILTGDVGGSTHKAIYRVSQPVPEDFYTLDGVNKIKDLKSRGLFEARQQKPDLSAIFFKDTVEKFKPVYEI